MGSQLIKRSAPAYQGMTTHSGDIRWYNYAALHWIRVDHGMKGR